MKIKFSLLISVYLIIIACVLVALYDHFFLQGALQAVLPIHPTYWYWWFVLFGFPHILASALTFLDKGYFTHYKKKIVPMLILITLFVAGVFVLQANVSGTGSQILSLSYFAFFLVATMHHVIGQQWGIAAMYARIPKNFPYQLSLWLSSLSIGGLYTYGYSDLLTISNQFPSNLEAMVGLAMKLALVVIIPCCLYMIIKAKTQKGRLFLFANMMSILIGFIFIFKGYSVFTFIILRVIHDVTAFIVYSTHNHNRNKEKTHNLLFRIFSFSKVPFLVLTPLTAIFLAGFASTITALGGFISVMTLFHYYIEGFIWKKESLHRDYVKFE